MGFGLYASGKAADRVELAPPATGGPIFFMLPQTWQPHCFVAN